MTRLSHPFDFLWKRKRPIWQALTKPEHPYHRQRVNFWSTEVLRLCLLWRPTNKYLGSSGQLCPDNVQFVQEMMFKFLNSWFFASFHHSWNMVTICHPISLLNGANRVLQIEAYRYNILSCVQPTHLFFRSFLNPLSKDCVYLQF